MSRILEFKDSNVEIITLDELRESVKISDEKDRHTRIHPVDHDVVFDTITNILNNNNKKYNMSDIHVMKGSVIKRIRESFNDQPVIESHWFKKITGTIYLNDYANKELNSMIKIEYTDTGINLAFGMNVLVCMNGMMAFRGDTLSTSGRNGMIWENAVNIIKAWISEHEKKVMQYQDLVNKMIATSVPRNALVELIGKLEMKAVNQAYIDTSVAAPLNIGQVSTFTRNLMSKLNKEEKLDTLWDVYNVATDLQKPGKMDIGRIIQDNLALTEFMIDEYNVEMSDID